MLKCELRKLGKFDEQHCKLLFSEHHLSHAASAFFGSDFQEAAIITVDGVGEWNTLSIAHGKANQIQLCDFLILLACSILHLPII